MDYLQPSRLPAALVAAAASTILVLIPGLIAEALFASVDIASMSDHLTGIIPVFVVALLHALVFGLPAHALVPLRWRYTFPAIAIGSFLVGALPMPLLLLLLSGGDLGGSPYEALTIGLALAGGLGVVGLAGGVAFWLIVRGWAE